MIKKMLSKDLKIDRTLMKHSKKQKKKKKEKGDGFDTD